MKNRFSFKALSLLLLLVIAGGAFKWRVDERIVARGSDDIRYIPSPEVAKVLAFGFKHALADVYWIEAINYFGEQLLSKKKNYKYLEAYADIILNLDPLFTIFYDWTATALIYNGLTITRDTVIRSTEYANFGIRKFNEVHRFDRNTILKGAFNYALETHQPLHAIPYFRLAALSFPEERQMLLTAAAYANHIHEPQLAASLKMEFLGQIAFEAQTMEELRYALAVINSAQINAQAMELLKALRLKMESEEDIKKILKKRFEESQVQTKTGSSKDAIPADPRLENVLEIEFSRTWMPPDLLVLLSL
jgi:hypothetical protein